jgi:hypothetical protein
MDILEPILETVSQEVAYEGVSLSRRDRVTVLTTHQGLKVCRTMGLMPLTRVLGTIFLNGLIDILFGGLHVPLGASAGHLLDIDGLSLLPWGGCFHLLDGPIQVNSRLTILVDRWQLLIRLLVRHDDLADRRLHLHWVCFFLKDVVAQSMGGGN